MDAPLTTVIGGELVELPGTIAGIRTGMTSEQAAAFGREIEHVPAADLPVALVHWALPARPTRRTRPCSAASPAAKTSAPAP
ncbi:hypothetical protein PUR49_10470 [Streptomyces sp. BE147]|uniref:hypothetical protein n=1 Tax=Streptomyces sp. BE147 TaxID=3002524 RepID=UPI002E792578|nr:hypothetical protein [Streptomyces sp. BE147]MEE1736923.1 hypothetical protein [Streptomyces sp. BE147]